MDETLLAVLQERVDNLATDVEAFKHEQAKRWTQNDTDHRDFYQRLPIWATLLIATLSSVATLGITLAVKR